MTNDERSKYRKQFSQGYCVEFATALQELNPDYKFAVIVGVMGIDEDYDEEMLEACHAVLMIDEKNYLDINGKNKFDKNDERFMFSSMPQNVKILPMESLEDVESFFGTTEEEMIDIAKEYINLNKSKYLLKQKNLKIETKLKENNNLEFH